MGVHACINCKTVYNSRRTVLQVSWLLESTRRLEGPACCPCPRGQKTTGWRHSTFKRRAAVRSSNQTSQCNEETRASVCASRIEMHSAIGRLLIWSFARQIALVRQTSEGVYARLISHNPWQSLAVNHCENATKIREAILFRENVVNSRRFAMFRLKSTSNPLRITVKTRRKLTVKIHSETLSREHLSRKFWFRRCLFLFSLNEEKRTLVHLTCSVMPPLTSVAYCLKLTC